MQERALRTGASQEDLPLPARRRSLAVRNKSTHRQAFSFAAPVAVTSLTARGDAYCRLMCLQASKELAENRGVSSEEPVRAIFKCIINRDLDEILRSWPAVICKPRCSSVIVKL